MKNILEKDFKRDYYKVMYIIGHPNCGLNYIEKTCSVVLKDVVINVDTFIKPEMNAKNTLIVIMNPIKAFPLIFQDNNTFEFRRKEILKEYDFDIGTLDFHDKVCMSYLYWINILERKLLEQSEPNSECYYVKLETPISTILQYSKDNNVEFIKGNIVPPFREKASVSFNTQKITVDILEQFNQLFCDKFLYEHLPIPKQTNKKSDNDINNEIRSESSTESNSHRSNNQMYKKFTGGTRKDIIFGPRRRITVSNYSKANPYDNEEPREVSDGLVATPRKVINVVNCIQNNSILSNKERQKLGASSFSIKR